MSILLHLMHEFDNLLDEQADEKTTNWPLMRSGSQSILLCLCYIIFVTSIGPRLMKTRKPYSLKNVIILYNAIQVVSCGTICIWILMSNPTIGCVPVVRSNSEKSKNVARICWWTMLLKLAEFVETILFVLRKKQNQVSKLHVYHHISTFIFIWGAVKMFPSDMVLFPIFLNSTVHTLMYTYYLLSALGPNVQRKVLGWKKGITIIQMVQFCLMVLHASQILKPSCAVSNYYAYLFIPNVAIVFYMFSQFYKRAYAAEKQKLSE